jgi:hypothetical protein
MGHVWNRHVVLELQQVIPLLVSIKDSGPEAECPKLTTVLIYFDDSPFEFCKISEEMTVMVEILDIYLKSTAPNLAQVVVSYHIALFRHNLE